MRARSSVLVSLSLFAVACGHSTNPIAPSASLPGQVSSPVSSGAAIIGTVISSVTASTFRTEATTLTVAVTGSTLAATVNSGQFTLQGVPPGNIELRFTGPGIDARLTITDVGDRDDIHITVRVTGNNAELEEHRHDKPDHRSELEGTLSDINLAARTFKVSGTAVIVPAGTPIRHGDTSVDFSALRAGDRVEVKGTASSTGVTATEVKVENAAVAPGNPGEPDDGDDDEAGEAELRGAVSNLGTTPCPSITFKVSNTPVATNGNTRFKDVACSNLKNGDNVEVNGTPQANGTVLAIEVEKKK